MWYFENKDGKSMNTVLIIVAIILSFGGGVFVGNKTAPKEIKHITYIENKTSANSYAIAANIDVEDNGVHRYITVSVEGITNIKILTITNGETNFIAETNTFLSTWFPKFPRIN